MFGNEAADFSKNQKDSKESFYYCVSLVSNSLNYLSYNRAGGEEYNIAGFNIPAMGMTWFLVTLFILRNTYDILQYLTNKKHTTLISVCVAILGIIIGLWIQLPFSLDLALLSFAFYHCGQLLRRKGIRASATKCAASAIVCGGGVLLAECLACKTYFEMVPRRYPILCITCALADCLLCIYVCQLLCKLMPNVLMKPIYAIGQHSILLFAIHFMDGIWYPIIEGNLNIYLSVLVRLLVDICLFFAILFIRRNYQRRIENLKSIT